MNRKEFLKVCGILGFGLPMQSALSACGKDNGIRPKKVLVIGAGAAGLSAAYLLMQQGVEVEILEASASYGGRMKRTTTFANFPIPLGAEWLHVDRNIFTEIVNDPAVTIATNTTAYDQDVDQALHEGTLMRPEDVGFTIDQKFINATWFDFFDQYVVPTVLAKINFNKVVQTIDYSSNQVVVKTANETFTADRVIVTIPVKLLQTGAINFIPTLSNKKQNAINNVTVWDGCKAFIKFSQKFYPALVSFDVTPASAGQKLYYDAAYGQNTNEHILGLFAVGTGTQPYVTLSDNDLRDYMLDELDAIFNGQASANYVAHIFQNWNTEPYAQGAYVYDQESWTRIQTLGTSVDNKLHFAGDAYTTGSDWSSVHTAARSARRAVEEMLG